MIILRKRNFEWFLVILSFAAFVSASFAQQTRAVIVETRGAQNKTGEVKLYEGSYALVIGESDYTGGWPVLPGVKADVAAIKTVLEKQGFEVRTLLDLKRADLTSAIDTFIDDYGYKYDNRLLIYFAGHGHTLKSADKRDQLGYIVSIDAPLPSSDEIAFKRKAMPMDDIVNFARKIQAKHALFVFDSCFSGKLVSKGAAAVPPFIMDSVGQSVRQFITSGSADQSVPDDSVFRKLFVRGIEGEADEDGDEYVLGSELAKYIKRELTNISNGSQTPQYGKIFDVDLNQGDFVFVSGAKPHKIAATKNEEILSPQKPVIITSPKPALIPPQTLSISNLTNTGVCLEPGASLSITADGSISLGSNIREAGPAGKDSFETFLGLTVPIDKQYYMVENFPLGALLCRFDYTNNWEYCSTSRTLTAEKKGCLTFDINDKNKTDNSGAFQVNVKQL